MWVSYVPNQVINGTEALWTPSRKPSPIIQFANLFGFWSRPLHRQLCSWSSSVNSTRATSFICWRYTILWRCGCDSEYITRMSQSQKLYLDYRRGTRFACENFGDICCTARMVLVCARFPGTAKSDSTATYKKYRARLALMVECRQCH